MLVTLAMKLLEVETDLIETAVAEELRRARRSDRQHRGEPCVFLQGCMGPSGVIAERLIERPRHATLAQHRLRQGPAWVEGKTARPSRPHSRRLFGWSSPPSWP
jgi:hypothetical protein